LWVAHDVELLATQPAAIAAEHGVGKLVPELEEGGFGHAANVSPADVVSSKPTNHKRQLAGALFP
jgi:hypothetical protein